MGDQNQIKTLILRFPHGESVKKCEQIAKIAEVISNAMVSSGGMCFSAISMHDDKGLDFSEDSMEYNFDYKKKRETL